MCGIFAVFHSSQPADQLRARALQLSRRLRHRGPDWSGIHVQKYCVSVSAKSASVCNVLAHERLAIVDPENGAQPLFSHDRKRVLAVNGEIYNHRQLRSELSDIYSFSTGSDCESILALYEHFNGKRKTNTIDPIEQKWNQFPCSETPMDSIDANDWNPIDGQFPSDECEYEPSDDFIGTKILNRLDGVFAFVLVDESTDHCFAARDPIGVCPLYVGWASDGSMWFASEFKSLHQDCVRFREFPPGHYYCSLKGRFVRYFKPKWLTTRNLPSRPYDPQRLREVLEQSVTKRLMCDVP
jgi:asparagine synthase (glutamine-hydrolysing)